MRLKILLTAVPLLALAATLHAAPPSKRDVAAFAERALDANCVQDAPGMAVLVARGDEVLFRDACGRASLELDVPLSPDQVFRIGSVTKQFAAAAVLKLADEGKLSLDDPLTKFVPGYPGGDAVTVAMLLNHTSGIRSYTDIPGVMEGPIRKDLDTARLIDTFKDEKPDFAPGQGWNYNNSGYVLLGAVIEAANGKPWHAYLKEAFFDPLGMAHTGYGNERLAVVAGHVSGYARKDDVWAVAPYLSMSQPHAAGALVSTVDDLLKWNRALHEGKLLGDETYRRMITPEGRAAESGYGFGVFRQPLRGLESVQHGGGIFGFTTYLLYVPEQDVTVAVLYNAENGLPPGRGTSVIARMLAAHALGRPYPEKKPIAVDAAALRAYEGVYRIDQNAVRVLRVVDGRLTSQRTGGLAHPLIPIARDVFLFDEGLSRMVFERDAGGRVDAMRFFPDDEGEGERVARSDEPLPTERAGIELPRAARERVTGTYAFQGMNLRVFLDGETLKTQLAGQPAFELFAESPTRFFLKVVDASLAFAPAEGAPDTATLHQGGRATEFRRVGD